MMPLDGDYWTITARTDILSEHGFSVPQTLEELATISEFFNGRDLDMDGTPDYGFCGKLSGLQPWVASLLYMLVGPMVQTHGKEHGMFFDVETLEPLVQNAAWAAAVNTLKRLNEAGILSSSGPDKFYKAGQCVFLAALPGTTKKALLAGVPNPAAGFSSHNASERILTPGSETVLDRASGQLIKCDGQGKVCPFEEEIVDSQGQTIFINRVPFFVTGGWGASIASFATESKKQASWDFLVHLSRSADVVSTGVMDAFRASQFDEPGYLNAGWTTKMHQEFTKVHSWAMGRDAESNVILASLSPLPWRPRSTPHSD
jgi:multiple sugar transport system substrate-binding protein